LLHQRFIPFALIAAAVTAVACRAPQPAPPVAQGNGAAPDAAHPPAAPRTPPRRVPFAAGVTADVAAHRVEVRAWTCLDAGWLEQVACSPRTREHESLLVVPARPSDIHAALLLAGFQSGRPGRWTYENETYRCEPPVGDPVAIEVRFIDAAGRERVEPIRNWIRDATGTRDFPESPWIFGGSLLRPNPPDWPPGEHYVADFTGSVIGLVTFGDELIGFGQVWADQDAVQPPEWEVNAEAVPPPGTEVTLVFARPAPARVNPAP
jgi:hypothetical protein